MSEQRAPYSVRHEQLKNYCLEGGFSEEDLSRIFFDATDEKWIDYLNDETFLQGKAHSIFFAENHAQVKLFVQVMNRFQKQYPEEGITIRGRGTGLSGGAVPNGGVILSLERMNRFFSVNIEDKYIHTEAGTLTAEIIQQAIEKSQGLLQYPVDVSSAESCSIGGNIATNASGPKSYKYSATRDYLMKVRIVYADGNDDWLGSYAAKDSTGLDLKNLICGSEGRLAIITEVIMKLVPVPETEMTVICGVDDYQTATRLILKLNSYDIGIAALEFIDEVSLKTTRGWPDPVQNRKAAVILELEGSEELLNRALEKIIELTETMQLSENIVAARDEKSRRSLWAARKQISENLKNQFNYKLSEDFCVPVAQITELVRQAHLQIRSAGFKTAIWGHAGQGNLHVNILFDSLDELRHVYEQIHELAEFCVQAGGSISGEHGLGRLKKDLKTRQHSKEYLTFEQKIKEGYDKFKLFNRLLD